jgi:hypothetical protein
MTATPNATTHKAVLHRQRGLLCRRLELEGWNFSGAWKLVLGVLTLALRPDQSPFDFHGFTDNSEEPPRSVNNQDYGPEPSVDFRMIEK